MKTKPALFLLALPLSTTLSAQEAGPGPAPVTQTVPGNRVTPGSILAAQIQEIVDTPELADESRQRQIAAAIRLAIATAMTNATDAPAAARTVLELAAAATEAAPGYADLIFRTVTSAVRDIPLLAGQLGLAEAVRDVVAEAVRTEGAGAEGAGAEGARTRPAASEFTGHVDDVIVSPSR